MLVLHAGLPKTGTTALQQVLAQGADALARAGVVYPEDSRDPDGLAHHPVAEELAGLRSAEGPVVTAFLRGHRDRAGRRTLISSEAFTNCFVADAVPAFLTFLRACAETGPVRIVLCLRRMDCFVESMYHQEVKTGAVDSDINAYLEARIGWPDALFRGIRAVRDAGCVEAIHVIKYRSCDAGLDAVLGLVPGLDRSGLDLPPAPRVNATFGPRAQALCLYLPLFERRLGLRIARADLLAALENGALESVRDQAAYTVMDRFSRLYFHEAALRSAREHGVGAYYDFFAGDPPEPRELVTLAPDLVTDHMMAALVAWVTGVAGRRSG